MFDTSIRFVLSQGASVVRMMKSFVGNENFQKGISVWNNILSTYILVSPIQIAPKFHLN